VGALRYSGSPARPLAVPGARSPTRTWRPLERDTASAMSEEKVALAREWTEALNGADLDSLLAHAKDGSLLRLRDYGDRVKALEAAGFRE
jgi:hypothetical protein